MAKKNSKSVQPLFTLSCKDIGSDDCGFSVTTHSTDEVKKAMFAHANYAHPDKLREMTDAQKQGMAKMMNEKLMK